MIIDFIDENEFVSAEEIKQMLSIQNILPKYIRENPSKIMALVMKRPVFILLNVSGMKRNEKMFSNNPEWVDWRVKAGV